MTLLSKLRFFLCVFFSIVLFSSIHAQSCLLPVTIEERFEKSVLVLEGELIHKKASWDLNKSEIYTVNEIRVLNVVKGNYFEEVINLVTRGGQLGESMQVDHPSLILEKGMSGLFFLENTDIELHSTLNKDLTLFKPSFSSLGFIHYFEEAGTAGDALEHYGALNNLFQQIQKIEPNFISYYDNLHYSIPENQSRAISISSFSPGTLFAGIKAQLTINGSGFGSTQGNGRVEFANADVGGAFNLTPALSEYVSWSNNQIVVEVPSGAGTGNIRVQNNAFESVESSNVLIIEYNVLNVNYNNQKYRLNLVDADNSGGIEFEFQSDFFNNTNALDAFLRALDSWRCSNGGGTGVYFSDGGSSSVDAIASDGVNIIRFDNGSELSSNVLGRTTTYYSGCFNPTRWALDEVDIVYNNVPGTSSYSWNFDEEDSSTSNSEFDFESIALHELGHGHLLGHVISPGDVMHYIISNGDEQRYLGSNDIDGGNDVISFSQGVCGFGAMMDDYFCSSLPIEWLFLETKQIESGVRFSFSLESSEDIETIYLMKSSEGEDFQAIDSMSNFKSFRNVEASLLDLNFNSNSYYRLKAKDANGLTLYSDVLKEVHPEQRKEIVVYPNPIVESLNILNTDKNILSVKLSNIDHSLIKEWDVTDESDVIKIDLPKIASGIYILQMRLKESVISQIIFKG